jgi:hypothetical protein
MMTFALQAFFCRPPHSLNDDRGTLAWHVRQADLRNDASVNIPAPLVLLAEAARWIRL